MSDLVVLGFRDEAAARLAYDEVLNLADNDDLTLEALALRTSGPAGRICIEVPDEMATGSKSSGPQLAEFLATILDTRNDMSGNQGSTADTDTALRVSSVVLVFMASHIAWQRFRETISVFDGVTVVLPASA